MDELDKVILLIMRLAIIMNANYYGWKVQVSQNKIILRKKQNELSDFEKDTSSLIDSFLNFEHFKRTPIKYAF